MPTVRIVRVKRTDETEHLLLHVTQTSKTRPLDLKLVATDHEHIYHGRLKGADVTNLKADQFTGSDDDLKDILIFAFMRDRPDGASSGLFDGVEMVAKSEKDNMELTIRKNISGITQRVFSLSLTQDDEREEISPFEWVDISVSITDDLREEYQSAQLKVSTQQDKIIALERRLEEFVQAKKQHDEDLLQKFAALLNSKKQKTRDLRYKLEQANVAVDDDMEDVKDEEDIPEEKHVRESHSKRPARKSRSKKRRAPSPEEDIEMDDSPVADEHDALETPQETDDDGNDDLNDGPALLSQSQLQNRNSRSLATRERPSIQPNVQAHAADNDDETDDEL